MQFQRRKKNRLFRFGKDDSKNNLKIDPYDLSSFSNTESHIVSNMARILWGIGLAPWFPLGASAQKIISICLYVNSQKNICQLPIFTIPYFSYQKSYHEKCNGTN